MAGPPLLQMRQAAARLIRYLDLESYPSTRVGVVEFNTVARTLCKLTNQADQAVTCVNRVRAA